MTHSRPRSHILAWMSTCLSLLLVLAAVVESSAQNQFYPYYGKNRVKYDKFDWHIYTTDHFEIYYYPELEEHLERVASYAESAYQQVNAALRHDLAFVVPLVLFKTHSEFEQQNIIPGASPEGVGAFAEPQRDRIALPIDEPPDGLYRLITHRAHSHFRVRYYSTLADPPECAPLGRRRAGRLHGWHLATARPDAGARCRGVRHCSKYDGV